MNIRLRPANLINRLQCWSEWKIRVMPL